jgi:hypothetical protein
MEPIYIAIIAVFPPLLLASLNAWVQSRKERRDASLQAEKEERDYARQDEVAARVSSQAAHTARLLMAAQEETKTRTDEVARLAALADERTNAQLKDIHTLVNSDMTAARTAERTATIALVVALQHTLVLNQERHLPTGTIEEEVARAQERIEELNRILADRLAAQQLVDAAKAIPPHIP